MRSNVVLFGGTGYVGTLVLAELLRSTSWRVVLPIRCGHSASELFARIERLCQQLNGAVDRDLNDRIRIVALPPGDKTIVMPPSLRDWRIEKVINAAGSVDYFAVAELDEGNVALTRRTLDFARRAGSMYVYVSSAFSAGYTALQIQEALHDEPDSDPTYYTRTKRLAERMVAESGLPYLILRPSVLIGDSRTGLYTGKPYGLYQFLKSFIYFLTDQYYPEVHVVAPEQPFHLLHQDAFTEMLGNLLHTAAPSRIVNMVSPEEGLPTARDLYEYFFKRVTRPRKVFLYRDIADVPQAQIPRRQRMFLHVTRVNAQIIGHRWTFNRDTVAHLEARCSMPSATTMASTATCVDAYVRDSVKCQAYLNRYRTQFPARTLFIPVA